MTVPAEKTVVLVGNPNVGKSLVFSRITGVHVVSANYPGTTIAIKTGRCSIGGSDYTVLDLPGLYSLDDLSQTDPNISGILEKADLIVNVVDATTLERNLKLTLQLLQTGKPLVVCLNIWDETAHRGITIDTAELETALGVPVIAASAKSGEGIHELVAAFARARPGTGTFEDAEVWKTIGAIVTRVQKLAHRHHTAGDRIGELTLHPLGGPLTALVVLALSFLSIRFVGEHLISHLLDPLFAGWYHPWIVSLCRLLPIPFIRDMLIGLSNDPLQSFGILTTGVYIAVVLVFPYFFSFYLLFGLLEDTGYLPRLAVVLDALFHRLGLHGYSSIPVMLGLGCKVPAYLATRTLPGRREKLLTVTLIMMSAPCLPQSAMIFSMGMHYGTFAVLAVFGILLILALALNLLLNRILQGETPELFMEIPAYRFPSAGAVARKLWSRITEYAVEVFPMIVVGVCVIHLLDALHVLQGISDTLGKPIAWILGLPPEIASVMLLGFLRKDVSIALLAPFHLSGTQFVIGCVFMALYLPCIAAFFTLLKELGILLTLKVVALVFFIALAAGGALHVIFNVFF